MSKKVFKSVRKTLSKFDLGHQMAKKMGLPEPSGDLLYGKDRALSPAEQAQKQAMDMAEQQANQAEQQMQMQLDAANLSAQQNAQLQQSMAERERLAQQAADAGKVETERATVELALTDPASARRKFRTQLGGTSKAPSIRV